MCVRVRFGNSGRRARLERAGGERRGRVGVRQRQHGARQRLLLVAVALPAALRYRHRAGNKRTVMLWREPKQEFLLSFKVIRPQITAARSFVLLTRFSVTGCKA